MITGRRSAACLILVFLILVSPPALAESHGFVVAYIEGHCEVEGAGAWLSLNVGDELRATARIRLEPDAFVELRGPNRRHSLTGPGVFALDELVEPSERVASWGLKELFVDRIRSIFQRTGRENASAAMGVRGSETENSNQIEWSTGEEEFLLVGEGAALLASGELIGAAQAFDDALLLGFPEDEPELRIAIALACADAGYPALALRYLPEEDALSPPSEILLRGRLLLETLAFEESASLMEGFAESDADPHEAQAALILASFAQLGLDNPPLARDHLERARTIDPDSAAAAEAARLLDELGG